MAKKVFIHYWGGEGYLTSATFHLMALMGMFESSAMDGIEQVDEIRYRCIDAATGSDDDHRWRNLCSAYTKYHDILYGATPQKKLICEDYDPTTGDYINILNEMTRTPNNPEVYLPDRFPGQKALLAIGISEEDMKKLNFKGGVFGKPYAGEVFYSNSDFDRLYQNAALHSSNDELVVINCGGYRGGGTAATFIPLESFHEITAAKNSGITPKRFSVIAGPSTQFKRTVDIDTSAYNVVVDKDVDIFSIDETLVRLDACVKDSDKHKRNKDKLKKAKPKAHEKDLNPDFCMGKYIDKLRADKSISQKVNATFVNMKVNVTKRAGAGEGAYVYDETSDKFQSVGQYHKLHITNLLNAVEIKDIIRNTTPYTGGGTNNIYGFYTHDACYTIHNVFSEDDVKRFYHFLEMIVIITEYIRPYFADLTLPHSQDFYKKWALSEGSFFSLQYPLVGTTGKAKYNNDFAAGVKRELDNFLKECGQPILHAFKDINDVSTDVDFFPKGSLAGFAQGIYEVISTLESDINVADVSRGTVNGQSNAALKSMPNSGKYIKDICKQMLTVMLSYSRATNNNPDTGVYNTSENTVKGKLPYFDSNFPRRDNRRDIGDANADAKAYAEELLKYVFDFVNDKIN